MNFHSFLGIFQNLGHSLWNFSTKQQRIFQNILGIRKKKIKVFPQKTQGFEKKLRVLEAMCLRLPPKNRPKKHPALSVSPLYLQSLDISLIIITI